MVDGVVARPDLFILLESVRLSEPLNSGSKELETVRLRLRLEVTLLGVVVVTGSRANIIVITLQDIVNTASCVPLGRLCNCSIFPLLCVLIRVDFDPSAGHS